MGIMQDGAVPNPEVIGGLITLFGSKFIEFDSIAVSSKKLSPAVIAAVGAQYGINSISCELSVGFVIVPRLTFATPVPMLAGTITSKLVTIRTHSY